MTSGSEGDRLYALPLEQFTQARDELAARLKSAGDATEAAEVKALRKPTTPAWAVNQLSRRSRDTIDELIDSADRLRKAQQELLHGGPAQAVWEATLAERDALGRLTEDAETILADAGYGATRATLDRISDTLAAAAADASSRALLRRGILTSEMQRAGFGDLLGGDAAESRALKSVPPPKAEREAPAQKKRPAGRGGPTAKAVLEAERDAARASKEAVRAGEDAEKAERASDRADEAEASARKRLAGAEKEAKQARSAATAARKNADATRREAERAQARLAKLRTTRRT
jgi:hypothetical protein